SEFLGELLCSLAPLGSVLDRTDSLIGPVQRQNERRHVILHWFTRRTFIRSPRRRGRAAPVPELLDQRRPLTLLALDVSGIVFRRARDRVTAVSNNPFC